MGVAQAMPGQTTYGFAVPAAATFTTSQGAKFVGVRTFAQEISHVTDGEIQLLLLQRFSKRSCRLDPMKKIDGLTTKKKNS